MAALRNTTIGLRDFVYAHLVYPNSIYAHRKATWNWRSLSGCIPIRSQSGEGSSLRLGHFVPHGLLEFDGCIHCFLKPAPSRLVL